MHVLLIEDDRRLAAGILKNLRDEQIVVDSAFDGIEGEHLALVSQFDVILLDIRLPRQDGWATCENLRRKGCSTPILMLTAQTDIDDRIRGLDTGADDYLTKPFHIGELLARMRALVRRRQANRANVLEIGGVRLDMSNRQVFREGRRIDLTSKEFSLLELLMLNEGRIVTRERIIESLWDMNFDPQSNIVEAFIKLLRRKVDRGFSMQMIQTVRGAGYTFGESKD
jgi:DNA-binding response OmpR family regulator